MIRAILIMLAAGAGTALLARLLCATLRRLASGRASQRYWDMTLRDCNRSFSVAAIAAAMYVALELTGYTPQPLGMLQQGLLIVVIAAVAWFVVRNLHVVEELAFQRFASGEDDLRGRRTRTQIEVVRRLTVAAVILVTVGGTLLFSDQLRRVGMSLLFSAGVVSVILSVAAQTSLAHAVAGVQVAFSDALRIDDMVVVEGDWGRIEELQLTYVVVRMWDGRRLILPTNYFTGRPYQNWTRYESRVLSAVELPVDYTADLGVLRAEARRLVETNPLWDRHEWNLQMVDVTLQGVTMVRVTASAADGASAWDLRCDIREGLVRFLRDQHPQWMPRRPAYQP